MEVLYIVLPLSLLFSALAVGIFVWAAKNGQFDDLDTPAMRVLFDENKHAKTKKTQPTSTDDDQRESRASQSTEKRQGQSTDDDQRESRASQSTEKRHEKESTDNDQRESRNSQSTESTEKAKV